MAPRSFPREDRRASDTAADPADSERMEISKNISWVLRRGAKSVGIDINGQGWAKIADLSKFAQLKDVSQGKLLQVINDSNANKMRYEVKGAYVRAYEKSERKQLVSDAAAATTASAPYTGAATAAAPHQQFAAAAPAAAAAEMHPALPYSFPSMPYGAPPHPMMSPYMHPYMASMGAFQQGMAAQAGAGRYVGRIKSYNAEKGFGFIECDMTNYYYQRDVFLHKRQIGDMSVGQWVNFVCEPNKSGMPQAMEVHPCGQALPPAATAGERKGDKGKGKGQGKGKNQGKDQKGGKGQGEGKGQKKKGDGGKSKEESTGGQPPEVAAA